MRRNIRWPAFQEQSGLSALDYFVAHAPARPEWFEPSDIPEKPVAVWQTQDGKPAEDRHELNPETGRMRQNILVNMKDFDAWDQMHKAELELQWPLYWAKTMLKRLGYSE